MTQSQTVKLLDPETIAKLQGLELRARSIVEGYVSGVHRSPFHGFSIEFAEHREYVPGDDLRYVDWKVFAKTDKVYLKRYEEETNLACYLLLDQSESMAYQGPAAALSKFAYAQCIAAALAYVVLLQRDSVGLVTFDGAVRDFVWASNSAAHLKQLTRVMEAAVPRGKTDAGRVFHDLAERVKKRGVMVVISDLLDESGSVLSGLKHLLHRGHDVIILHVLDRAELEFPFVETTLFRGLEGLPNVLAEPRLLRAAYRQRLREFLRKMEAGCRAQGVDYTRMPTDRPLGLALSNCLAVRMSRPK
jgi:uncharacterized protein (DUF58 family)